MVVYDEILPLMGGFGFHQWKLYFLGSFPTIVNLFFKMGNVILLAKPRYRCMLPHETENSSYDLNDTEKSHWYSYDNLTSEYSSCSIFLNSSKCEQFVFDNDQYGTTAVIEFGITCAQEYLIASANSISMFGFMIGSFIFGNASDRWGRKPVFMFCAVAYLLLGTLVAFSSNIWMFLFLKVPLGAVASGIFFTYYVLLIEAVEPSKRILINSYVIIFFPTGFIIESIVGYFTPTWRYAQLVLTFAGLPMLLYFWLIPESARWLISRNKVFKAKKYILSIAKQNRTILLKENLDSLLSDLCTDKKYITASILDARRYPVLRMRIIILIFISFVVFLAYYGVSWNAGKLSGNLYVNVALMGLMDMPGIILILYIGQKYGRRAILCSYMALGGICLLATTSWLSNHTWVLIWTLISKLFIGAAVNISYVFSSEIYPTALRNAGMGLNAIFCSLGSIVAPYIFYLDIFWRPLPIIIAALLLILAACSCLLLPETFKKKLPETLEEGDSFGRK